MLRRRGLCCLVLATLWALLANARAGDAAFPFGVELMLDTARLPGGKRIPMIEIEDNGSATIDLWCVSVRASATVGDGALTIVVADPPPPPPPPPQCTPARQAGDQDLLAALSQVTAWRLRGEVVELVGPTTLRFRRMTN
jgi:hypothetical protein